MGLATDGTPATGQLTGPATDGRPATGWTNGVTAWVLPLSPFDIFRRSYEPEEGWG